MSRSVSKTTTTLPNEPAAVAGGEPAHASRNSTTLSSAREAWVRNIAVLLSHKTFILGTAFLVTALVGVYAFTKMQNYYKATTVILPARKAGGALDNVTSGLASSLKDLGMTKLGGSSDESYTPLSLMTSRELQRKLTKQFGFQKIYDDPTLEDATDDFSSNLQGDVSQEGAFTVSFEDTDPVRAAKVANAVVDEVNNLNSNLMIEEAKHNVSFTEDRYNQNAAALDSAETALGEFQRKYGVFSLPDQAKAELTAMAAAEQEKSAAEISLHSAEQLYGTNSSEAQVWHNTINGLAGKIGQMQAGMDSKASSFVPTSAMPDVALKYLRLMREVEIQSKLKAFLLPAYEQARLDQNKNLLGFLTLDRAVPPLHKSRPHRSIILLVAFFSSMAVAIAAVIFFTRLKTLRAKLAADRLLLGV